MGVGATAARIKEAPISSAKNSAPSHANTSERLDRRHLRILRALTVGTGAVSPSRFSHRPGGDLLLLFAIDRNPPSASRALIVNSVQQCRLNPARFKALSVRNRGIERLGLERFSENVSDALVGHSL